jgi:hypothetical protein
MFHYSFTPDRRLQRLHPSGEEVMKSAVYACYKSLTIPDKASLIGAVLENEG